MDQTNLSIADQSRQIVRTLREHRISPTSQRVAIAGVMLSKPQHLSADQIFTLTNEETKRVSKATVYNTLGLFARKGLVRELLVDSERVFYDSNTRPHCHFYNPESQELIDVDADEIGIRLPENLPEGMEIDNIDVVIHLKRPV